MGKSICPCCASAAPPLLVGQPGPVDVEAAEAGQLALGGSFVSDDGTDPNWYCPAQGHLWRDSDQALWRAVYEEAVAGRPYCPCCGSPSRPRIDSRDAVVAEGYVLPWGDRECLTCGHLWLD